MRAKPIAWTQKYLRLMVEYDPETGIAKWYGTEFQIGGNNTGYRVIVLDGQPYVLHRVIWKWMTGEDPPRGFYVDHKNRDPRDNRWANLRLATPSQNVHNTSRRKETHNVRWDSKRSMWSVVIQVGGKFTRRGHFKEYEQARTAARELRLKLLGEFAPDHDHFIYPPGM